MNFREYVPIISWLPSYKKQDFRGDLIAGLTVGVMLIPQGMAYAMLAGLPPIYGLYAAIVPLILYAIFGTSRQLAVGPVAMVSLLILAGVGTIATSGSEEYIALAIILAFLVGAIQLAMGVFRLGFLVNFLSHPVIAGFTSAAALIIGFSQLKHLMGIDIPRSNYIHEIIANAASKIVLINLPTFLVGATAIAILVLVKKTKLPVPGPLLVVIGSILAVWGLGLYTQGVKIVGVVPEGLPSFSMPAFDWESIKKLFPIALTIAFIGFMESIAVAKAIQSKHKNYKIVPNQELIALGMANIGGSFFQAFPTTGGFSRTAVNDQSGAKTGLASIISAFLIALTLLFLTPLFYYLPKAILASVIMVAVFGLINFKEAKHLWHTDRGDFLMMLVTFIATLFLGIEEGILIGVVLSLGLIIFRTTQPHVAVLGKIPGKPHYKNIDRFKNLEVRKEVLILRFDARLYFANANYFKEIFEKEIENKGEALEVVIFDADSMNGIDSSGVSALEEVINDCTQRNLRFFMVGIKGPVRDILHRSGLVEKIGKDHVFFRIQNAVDFIDQKQASSYKDYALQTNAEE
ncbi:MAG: SulP family sulfate permease [Saprospiraceae bacterium]|jgi:SulP family sulfate permease